MRYSLIAAALMGLTMAMPYADDKHDDKHDVDHKDDKKDEWKPVPPPPPPKDEWKDSKDPKDHKDDKDHHDDKKDEWKPVPEPKKDDWKPAPAPTPKPDWKPAPVDDKKKCTYTKTYVTKECGNDKDKWDNCKEVTKTKTEYDDKCTWGPAPVKETWAPAPVKPEEKKCSTTIVYTTKECGADKDKWDNCKEVVKTKTEYPEKCTWGEAKAPEAKTTWAEVPAKTPEAAATWAPAPVKPAPAASSTVWAPVAKWTGAADKQAVGVGALAIAAVAALL